MARLLDVYLQEHLVGCLVQDNHGEMAFQYAESWINSPNARALSQSLRLRAEEFSRSECRGFFGGILPEGKIREVIARNLGVSARNDVALLERIGGECAGAVTFIPSGKSLPMRNDQYRPLTNQELADILENLPRCPLLTGEEHVRLSLAGAQDKLAVYIVDEQIFIPLEGAPSTHILKPAIAHFDGIVVNEALCMKLAKAIGLPIPAVEFASVEGIDYLRVERYDRIRVERQPPERLHQEDFCQALGIVPENKYQNEGGPSIAQCFQLLRDASSVPAVDINHLLNAVIFNFLIGNNDAHGKNFSLLYSARFAQPLTTSLAPFYDLVCTACYPDLSQRMAMKLGGEYDAAKVSLRHFDRLAEEASLSKPLVKRRLQSLAESIKLKLSEVTSEHPAGIKIAELIRSQCDRTLEMFRK